ncbi:MAG: RusA family crossover junction endodeoxyribonuclease, partial [Phycisphaerales bacterium]
MNALSFVVMGNPEPKQRARRGQGGRWYTPDATKKYEAEVAKAAMVEMQRHGVRRGSFGPPITIMVRCYFKDHRRRDGDNVLKAVQDGCNGVVWNDDSDVRDARVTCLI